MLFLLPAVVGIESHAVEVKSLARRQIYIEFLFGEGLVDSLLSLQLFIVYLNKQSYHLPNLVVDETLPNYRKPHKVLTP